MKHRVAKRKFGFGYDANKMLLRQLCRSFFLDNGIKTSKQRAKAAQMQVEKLVTKSKLKNEANKNYILRFFGDIKMVDHLFSKVGPSFEKIMGGYTKLSLIGQRESDGAMMAQLSWAHPLKSEKKVAEKNEKPVESKKIDADKK